MSENEKPKEDPKPPEPCTFCQGVRRVGLRAAARIAALYKAAKPS